MADELVEGREEGVGTGSTRTHEGRALSERFNTIAFWFLAIFLLGACAGIGAAFKYHSSQLDRSIRLGCFIHEGVVYEVVPKIQKQSP
jgi:hypothetical protein